MNGKPMNEAAAPGVTVRFFASLRESVGHAAISIEAPNFKTLADQLQAQLSQDAYAALLEDNIRVAVNQTLVDSSWAELSRSSEQLPRRAEVAFMPPVTGG